MHMNIFINMCILYIDCTVAAVDGTREWSPNSNKLQRVSDTSYWASIGSH